MGAVTNAISAVVSTIAGGGGSPAPAPVANPAANLANQFSYIAKASSAGQQNMSGTQNAKQAGSGAALSSAMQAGLLNGNQTLLNGPNGVEPSKLLLDKNTLLGG